MRRLKEHLKGRLPCMRAMPGDDDGMVWPGRVLDAPAEQLLVLHPGKQPGSCPERLYRAVCNVGLLANVRLLLVVRALAGAAVGSSLAAACGGLTRKPGGLKGFGCMQACMRRERGR